MAWMAMEWKGDRSFIAKLNTCPASTKFDYEYYHNSIQKHQYIKNDQNKLLKQYIVSQQIKITFKS